MARLEADLAEKREFLEKVRGEKTRQSVVSLHPEEEAAISASARHELNMGLSDARYSNLIPRHPEPLPLPSGKFATHPESARPQFPYRVKRTKMKLHPKWVASRTSKPDFDRIPAANGGFSQSSLALSHAPPPLLSLLSSTQRTHL